MTDPVLELDNHIATARLLAAEIGAEPPMIAQRYELIKTLGRGAYGLVCEAEDLQLRRPVALKLVPLRGPRAAERTIREAQTLAQFDHPNIVRIFDVGQTEEVAGHSVQLVFVVMELLRGTNLRHWLAQRPSLSEIHRVFVAAGEGLAAAHERRVIHGDFKPENVVLDEGGRVRVVDFGLARLGGGEVPSGSVPSTTARTLTQGPRGTPGYIAPEVLAGRIDARSDQFSFAISLWEAVLGRMPIPDDPDSRLASPALQQLLTRASASAPEERFVSMQALLDALRTCNFYPSALSSRPRASFWHHPLTWLVGGTTASFGLLTWAFTGTPTLARQAAESPRVEAPAAAQVEACPELAAIAGDWSFTTAVAWTTDPKLSGAHGFYRLTVVPERDCQAAFLVRKHGDSGQPNYRNPWQDRVVASLSRTREGLRVDLDTWLGKNRPLDGSDTHRDGLHYRYTLRWHEGQLTGDWAMLDDATGTPSMHGQLTGIRGASQG